MLDHVGGDQHQKTSYSMCLHHSAQVKAGNESVISYTRFAQSLLTLGGVEKEK